MSKVRPQGTVIGTEPGHEGSSPEAAENLESSRLGSAGPCHPLATWSPTPSAHVPHLLTIVPLQLAEGKTHLRALTPPRPRTWTQRGL